MQNEEKLVQLLKEGDQGAFNKIYEEYFTKIYRYVALKISNQVEAEDITQEVFVRALESISSFKWQGRPFSSWLFRIAHNQVIDYFRKAGKRNTLPLADWDVVDAHDGPQEITEQEADIKQVLTATKKLSKAQQEVISLRFAGGLSIAQAAKSMGKSEGAIKALQHSAIVVLRKTLVGQD